MDELEMKATEFLLVNVARTLGWISTDRLEYYVKAHQDSLSRWGTMGPMIDPTQYRKQLQSGELEDAKHQLEIAEALLTARKAIDIREEYIKGLQS